MKLVPTASTILSRGSIISSWGPQVGCGHSCCIPFSCNTDAEKMDG